MGRLLGLLSFWLLLGTASAVEQRYVASEHESTWVASSSRLYCSLTHEIPIYGKAVFERTAGETLGLWVRVKRKPAQSGVAQLHSLAPQWKHGANDRDLGQIDYRAEQKPFRIGHTLSRRLLLELEQGMFPTFLYKDWSDGRDDVSVSLSAVNVRQALGEFIDCMRGQFSFGFDDIARSSVYFDFNESGIRKKERPRLDEIAEYLVLDSAVAEIRLEGHTDSKGRRRYNDRLGKKRAEAVRDYLVERGVDVKKVTIRIKSYGERRPTASNRSPQGRQLNRVVNISLFK